MRGPDAHQMPSVLVEASSDRHHSLSYLCKH